ncbi:hypothetical protein TWF730_006699 [Orbilia blumenaviensis]|uniref:Uncharacterized protein n=1 Tax=Orbilia blumenaviensis TaxID=1796055 RepID=A0AAV9VHC2_9PEZI
MSLAMWSFGNGQINQKRGSKDIGKSTVEGTVIFWTGFHISGVCAARHYPTPWPGRRDITFSLAGSATKCFG